MISNLDLVFPLQVFFEVAVSQVEISFKERLLLASFMISITNDPSGSFPTEILNSHAICNNVSISVTMVQEMQIFLGMTIA